MISRELKERKLEFTLITSTEHDSRTFTAKLTRAFAVDQLSPAAQIEFDPVSLAAKDVAQRAIKLKNDSIVLVANTAETRALLEELRAGGFKGAIFTGPWGTSISPTDKVRSVVVPKLGDVPEDFRKRFARHYGHDPNYAAAHAYDAASILVVAIRKAGLNRVRILDAVRGGSPWQGVTGTIEWDTLGQNRREPRLVKLGQPN
jgi:ABC-type branched-subunit amino acid transport system substrate-binding protein